jgi:hypothetical protein
MSCASSSRLQLSARLQSTTVLSDFIHMHQYVIVAMINEHRNSIIENWYTAVVKWLRHIVWPHMRKGHLVVVNSDVDHGHWSLARDHCFTSKDD